MRYILFLTFISAFISCKRMPTSSQAAERDSTDIEETVFFEDTLYKDFTTADFYPVLHSYDDIKALNKVLFNEKLVSNEQYFDLLVAIKDSAIKEDFQLVSYFKDHILIDRQDFEEMSPEQYYQIIYDSLLKFSGFKNYKLNTALHQDTFPEERITETTIAVDIITPEGKFSTENYYYTDELTDFGWLDEGFYKVINQMLARKKSDKRLVQVLKFRKMDYGAPEYVTVQDYSTLGFLLFDRSQYRMLRPYDHILNFSIEDYTPLLNRTEIKRYTDQYKEQGLLPMEVPDSILNMPVSSPEQILKYASEDVYCSGSTASSSYEKLLQELSSISKGKFLPTAVKVKPLSAFNTEVRFNYRTERHAFRVGSGSADINIPSVVEQVNKILNKQDTDGNYYLLEDPEAFCYIFLSEDEVNRLNTITGAH